MYCLIKDSGNRAHGWKSNYFYPISQVSIMSRSYDLQWKWKLNFNFSTMDHTHSVYLKPLFRSTNALIGIPQYFLLFYIFKSWSIWQLTHISSPYYMGRLACTPIYVLLCVRQPSSSCVEAKDVQLQYTWRKFVVTTLLIVISGFGFLHGFVKAVNCQVAICLRRIRA